MPAHGGVNLAGNQTVLNLGSVELDTGAPVIQVNTTIPTITNNPSLDVRYTVDGGTEQVQNFPHAKLSPA